MTTPTKILVRNFSAQFGLFCTGSILINTLIFFTLIWKFSAIFYRKAFSPLINCIDFAEQAPFRLSYGTTISWIAAGCCLVSSDKSKIFLTGLLPIKYDSGYNQKDTENYNGRYESTLAHGFKKFSSPTSTLLSASKIKIWF